MKNRNFDEWLAKFRFSISDDAMEHIYSIDDMEKGIMNSVFL